MCRLDNHFMAFIGGKFISHIKSITQGTQNIGSGDENLCNLDYLANLD